MNESIKLIVNPNMVMKFNNYKCFDNLSDILSGLGLQISATWNPLMMNMMCVAAMSKLQYKEL